MPDFPRNVLAGSDSPYLLQHAGNPVAWQPWGDDAFARAKRENKPVFLSIGYSTCHWCHVMAHESFENPDVADLLNRNFVSIKVDREERPDVDMTYMTYVQAVTGHGGWPMSVFLTPDALPFFGGTYFPPDDRYGRTGFINLLGRIQEMWGQQAGDMRRSAVSAITQLRAAAAPVPVSAVVGWDSAAFARAATAAFARQFDTAYAGFGGAPKFPRPAAPQMLLEIARVWPEEDYGRDALRMAVATLQAMADGGIHDHLGGGFHRYAVDRIWHIPHYEKMLYDQAQLARLYLEAARLTGLAAFDAVADGIFTYVLRDLTHPGGGFFSAEDADSLPADGAAAKREGAFYVFTALEIAGVLPVGDARIFCAAYGVQPDGNADPASDPHGELTGTNTLFRAIGAARLAGQFHTTVAEIDTVLARSRAALLALRSARPRPHRDGKIVAAWNGMMIGALATGARLLQRPDWLRAAERAAEFIHANLWDVGRAVLFRSLCTREPTIHAFAADYAQMIAGLLDLHAATGAMRWLAWAIELQAVMDRDHRDDEDGCYFSAREDGGLGVLSLKEDHDGAEPSPNSLAAVNLLRLAALTGEAHFREAVDAMIASLGRAVADAPHVAPVLGMAILRSLEDPGHVVLAPADAPSAAPLRDAILRHAAPGMAVIPLPGAGEERAWWLSHHAWMAGLPAAGDTPAVILCRDRTCGLPMTDPEEVARALTTAAGHRAPHGTRRAAATDGRS